VLVTGAGGAAGIAVIRALTGLAAVVAADADETAAGLRLASQSGILPTCTEHGFGTAVVKLAVRTGANAVISTIAEEIPALVNEAQALAAAGVAHWLPEAETVSVCLDKWAFARTAAAAGIPVPATGLATLDGVPGPWIVKPRFGRGSRDVYRVGSTEEAEWALRRVPQPIVQTFLRGREFTVDCLMDRDHNLVAAVPRWRIETKAGISTKGVTFHSPNLIRVVESVLLTVSLTGPANVQGFIDDDSDIAITEVNPRFSGGLPLTLAAGAELVAEYLNGIYGLPINSHRLQARAGVRMSRYFSEVFDDIHSLEGATIADPAVATPLPNHARGTTIAVL
jgi:carbamoyl-phosphate synthase large subunit